MKPPPRMSPLKSQWQRKCGEDRNQQWNGEVARERDNRPRQKDPTGVIRDDRLFGKEFRDVVVRLQNSRATTSLQPTFGVRDDTADERSAEQDRQNLDCLNAIRRHNH